MFRKPLIGLNTDLISATHKHPEYSLICSGYYDAVTAIGGIPILVPPIESDNDLNTILDKIDGFVLTGGRDLDPRNDGFMLHHSVRQMEARREEFDRRLCEKICDRRMPVFGIGVGLQLLNVTMGGNLFLHIPDDLPKAIAHKDPHDRSHRHGLVVEPNSVMERVYGDGEVRVNSMHHMAIDEVAPGFIATAYCPDGVIEAIESRIDGWFAIGTQFHPEADSASALDIRIFEEFIFGINGEGYADCDLGMPLNDWYQDGHESASRAIRHLEHLGMSHEAIANECMVTTSHISRLKHGSSNGSIQLLMTLKRLIAYRVGTACRTKRA